MKNIYLKITILSLKVINKRYIKFEFNSNNISRSLNIWFINLCCIIVFLLVIFNAKVLELRLFLTSLTWPNVPLPIVSKMSNSDNVIFFKIEIEIQNVFNELWFIQLISNFLKYFLNLFDFFCLFLNTVKNKKAK